MLGLLLAGVAGQAAGLPQSVMLVAAKDDTNDPVPVNAAVVASEQQVANAFYSAGLIPTKVDMSKFVDERYSADSGT